MKLEESKIETIRAYFRTRPVLRAYLFGSYVRGHADDESDIDILVDLEYSEKIGLQFKQMKLKIIKNDLPELRLKIELILDSIR